MREIDTYTDFIEFIDTPPDEMTLLMVVQGLEDLFCDPSAVRKRVKFLRSGSNISKDNQSGTRTIDNPLTEEQLKDIITEGLVAAHRQGTVLANDLLALGHSIEGIENLLFELAATPLQDQAECWSKFSANLDEIPSPDITPVLENYNKDTRTLSDKDGGRYIIYVDDIEAETVAVIRLLESRFSSSFRIRGFTSPMEALEFVEKRKKIGHTVAAVVTDMYMPEELNGDELAEKLHLVDPDLPVVGYSGHNDYQDPEQARQAGLVDLIPKNLGDSETLVTAINSAIND